MNTMHRLNKTEKDEAKFDARKELELKVRNDFVNHWSEVYKGEYDYLATLVGRTPEPIIRTILSINPKKVLFIHTKDTIREIDEIVQETKLKPSGFEKELVNGSNPDDTYESIKKYALKWGRMCVDISGGKKAMTGGGAIAAAFLNLDILYNDYEKYNTKLRMPEPGTEFLNKLDNPFDTSQDVLERIGIELFNNYDYFNARIMFEKAKEQAVNPLRFEILLQLSKAYHGWDSFEFAYANKSFEIAMEKIDQYRIDPGFDNSMLQFHKKVLGLLAGVHGRKYVDVLSDNEVTKALVYTCYTSALRMEGRGRFTDGVLRLYRCCEMMGQNRLALVGIDTSNVDVGEMDEGVVERFRRIKAGVLSKSSFRNGGMSLMEQPDNADLINSSQPIKMQYSTHSSPHSLNIQSY